MRQARIRVRVTKVKLEGLTFDQQHKLWRDAINLDPAKTNMRLIGSAQFSNWVMDNLEAVTKLATGYRP